VDKDADTSGPSSNVEEPQPEQERTLDLTALLNRTANRAVRDYKKKLRERSKNKLRQASRNKNRS